MSDTASLTARPGAEAAMAALRASPVRHLVAGMLENGSRTFPVINPATGEPCAVCPEASRAQLDRAVAAAGAAQPAWAATSVEQRRARLDALAQVLLRHEDELAALITLEQGKPLLRALDEVRRAAFQVGRVAALPFGSQVLREDANGRIELHRRPLGVVGAIAPWNMPIVLALPKITHALYTGNTIVLKPSPYTPLATLRLGEYARELFPPGVLNILAGGDEFGRWMSEHAGIAKLSFTGSIATGKKVMAAAAAGLKRVTLELGGNDAAIVLPDADVPAMLPRIFAAAFANNGQVCMAIKRLYVHEAVHDQVAEGLAALARSARVGDGFDPDVDFGPVQNRMQHEVVQRILADTRERGGHFLAGGHVLDRAGYFVAPTIVTGLPEDAALVQEEPFGPVLPVLRFSDVDDAVRRANATRFGLGASVWSRDIAAATAIAHRLEAGVAWVNAHMALDACAPFGGVKESGLGREYGEQGLAEYTNAVSLYVPATAGN